MNITFTSKGTPVMDIDKYRISLVNTGNSKDKWNWVSVKVNNKSEVVPLDLKGLKTNIMPMKTRNKIKRVFNKYESSDGYIYKKDLDSLYKDLKLAVGKSATKSIDDLFDLLK